MPHDAKRRTAYDWSGYLIHRKNVPRRIGVELIDRPGTPFLGVGEVAQGPTAALANAIAAAGGGAQCRYSRAEPRR